MFLNSTLLFSINYDAFVLELRKSRTDSPPAEKIISCILGA